MGHSSPKQPPKPSGATSPARCSCHDRSRSANSDRSPFVVVLAGATNLRRDYLEISEGVKNGTLKPLGPPVQPVPWNVTNHRFSSHPLGGLSLSFGEPFNARLQTSASYSFGKCSRADSKLVFAKVSPSGVTPIGQGAARQQQYHRPLQCAQFCVRGVRPGRRSPKCRRASRLGRRPTG